jgi:UDP-N-acetylmuramate--alanine ligase
VVDQLILVPVYAASEAILEGGTSEDLYKQVTRLNKTEVSLAASVTDAWNKLRKIWRDGDLVLIIGAGDVDLVAKWAREELTAG